MPGAEMSPRPVRPAETGLRERLARVAEGLLEIADRGVEADGSCREPGDADVGVTRGRGAIRRVQSEELVVGTRRVRRDDAVLGRDDDGRRRSLLSGSHRRIQRPRNRLAECDHGSGEGAGVAGRGVRLQRPEREQAGRAAFGVGQQRADRASEDRRPTDRTGRERLGLVGRCSEDHGRRRDGVAESRHRRRTTQGTCCCAHPVAPRRGIRDPDVGLGVATARDDGCRVGRVLRADGGLDAGILGVEGLGDLRQHRRDAGIGDDGHRSLLARRLRGCRAGERNIDVPRGPGDTASGDQDERNGRGDDARDEPTAAPFVAVTSHAHSIVDSQAVISRCVQKLRCTPLTGRPLVSVYESCGTVRRGYDESSPATKPPSGVSGQPRRSSLR